MDETSPDVLRLPAAPPAVPKGWSLYAPALLLLALGFAVLPLDLPLAKIAKQRAYPPHLAQLVEASEPYGHGIGVAFLLLAIFFLDPDRRRAIPRIALMSLGSGLASNLIKIFIHRTRPNHFDFDGGVFDTFKQWAPAVWRSTGSFSCPSSHTATAMGMTLALAWYYPKGRRLFVGLTVMVGCQRVLAGAHFPSDVLWGAAVGWVLGTMALQNVGLLYRSLSRWENGPLEGHASGAAEAAAPAAIASEMRRAA